MYANNKFVSLLEGHIKRQAEEGVLEDVWDGNIWKEFLNVILLTLQNNS